MLDLDIQDRIISNYTHYKIYGYHLYDDEPIIVAITNLWDAEIKKYLNEEKLNLCMKYDEDTTINNDIGFYLGL